MIIEIDFNSNEALYMQLRNQIIMGMREIPCRVYGSWRIPSGSICIL